MKKLKITSICMAIVLTVTLYGYKEFNRKNRNLKYLKSVKQMTASELISDFENNEQQANARYLDKIITITGTVKEVIKGRNGIHFAVLGENKSISSVRCFLDSTGQERYPEISAGDQLTIKGVCTGYKPDLLLGSEVILNRSVIITQMEATKYD